MKQPLLEIDVKDTAMMDSWRHNCPCLKSLDRHARKWFHRTAPLSGIVLLNGDMVNRVLAYDRQGI